jgi:hypothetical protein
MPKKQAGPFPLVNLLPKGVRNSGILMGYQVQSFLNLEPREDIQDPVSTKRKNRILFRLSDGITSGNDGNSQFFQHGVRLPRPEATRLLISVQIRLSHFN